MKPLFENIHATRIKDHRFLDCDAYTVDTFQIFYFIKPNAGKFIVNGMHERMLNNRLFLISPGDILSVAINTEEIVDCFHIHFISNESHLTLNESFSSAIVIPTEHRTEFDRLHIQLAIVSVLDDMKRKTMILQKILEILDQISTHCTVLLANRHFGRMIHNIPRHVHQNTFQIDYFFSGIGSIYLEDRWIDYSTGTLCFIPPEVTHEIVFSPAKTIDNYSIKFQVPATHVGYYPKTPFMLQVPETHRNKLLLLIKKIVGEFVMDAPIHPRRTRDLLKYIAEIRSEIERSPANMPGAVQQIKYLVASRYSQELRIGTLAYEVGISPEHLSRLFKKETGQTLTSYILEQRLNTALNMMKNSHVPFKRIAVECGFKNVNYFTTCFKKHIQMTPSEYRARIMDDEQLA